MFCFWVLPPFLPFRWFFLFLCPFFACREVAYHRVEPDVDAFVLKAEHGDFDTPVDISGDRPVVQSVLQPIIGKFQYVCLPVAFILEPCDEF